MKADMLCETCRAVLTEAGECEASYVITPVGIIPQAAYFMLFAALILLAVSFLYTGKNQKSGGR